MLKLRNLSGILRGRIIELGDGRISVGRGLDNVLHLEDGTVSQHHAEFLVECGNAMVRDLGSTNGTRVNGRKITEARLIHGDQVSFGKVEVLFESEAGQQESTPTPRDGDVLEAGAAGISENGKPCAQRATVPSVEFKSRFHALAEAQVVPDSGRCVQCGICSYNCPAGIDVRAHAWRGRAIFDSHCLTCSECVNRCPRGVLRFEKLALFGQAN